MAQMNPGIILAGEPVNALRAMQEGTNLAAQTQSLRDHQAMQNLYSQHGAGILAGDQNALNALAGRDPMQALQVQSTRQGMRAREQEIGIARENAKLRGLEFAAQMDANQRQQALADVERAGAMMTQAQTPEQFAAILQMPGVTESVEAIFGPGFAKPENRDLIIAGAAGLKDALAMNAPQEPADEYQRYVQEETAAGRTPLDRIQYAQAKKGQGFEVTTADGTTVKYGGGNSGAPTKLTEGQSKDLVYFERATGASPLIDQHQGSLTSLPQRGFDAIPGVGNMLVSEDYQKGRQAAAEWLAAILRKDTGAAITSQEFDLYGPMYLPMPGDGPETLAQKKDARKRAEGAIKRGLGTAEVIAEEMLAQREAQKGSSGIPPAPEGIDGITPETWPQIWEAMPDEDKALFR